MRKFSKETRERREFFSTRKVELGEGRKEGVYSPMILVLENPFEFSKLLSWVPI
jgi:hypothetical protein